MTQVFESFFPQQEAPIQRDPQIQHNEIIMEMANNWESVKCLAKKIKDGTLESLDQFEQIWYNVLLTSGMDVSLYEDENSFMAAWIK